MASCNQCHAFLAVVQRFCGSCGATVECKALKTEALAASEAAPGPSSPPGLNEAPVTPSAMRSMISELSSGTGNGSRSEMDGLRKDFRKELNQVRKEIKAEKGRAEKQTETSKSALRFRGPEARMAAIEERPKEDG